MAGQKLLLPYNFSSYDQKALNFVVNAFANQEDIKITLFHAYTLNGLSSVIGRILRIRRNTVMDLSMIVSHFPNSCCACGVANPRCMEGRLEHPAPECGLVTGWFGGGGASGRRVNRVTRK